MTTTLDDIRVGDIMRCLDGEEREIEQCALGIAHAGDDLWWDLSDLRNPEFRVGDKVRIRGGNPKEVFPWNGKRARPDHCYALVERAPVVQNVDSKYSESTKCTNRCTLCGHLGPRHYASCEHNPEPKGTLISTLGWDQPPPIVVLCQNDEDAP